ncbi:MAG: AmmeMemoRadiSam system protein A [Syntrophales bacterium]|nr:AmmeMemoRadiSam system protein A [Syntrophales bacterium]
MADQETGRLLTDTEKEELLEIAKQSIESRLTGKKGSGAEPAGPELKRGAFVSLHRRGRLRGCIGCIEARSEKLGRTVREMASAAAFNDPRFPPLKKEELQDLDIEISVLTPLRKITDINEIKIGMHGLYVVNGFCSGLLLPQVATEYGWEPITFLEETCRKAGLPPGSWKNPETQIYVFSADIFGSR